MSLTKALEHASHQAGVNVQINYIESSDLEDEVSLISSIIFLYL